MTAAQPAEDGSLPLAMRELEDAIHALCGSQSKMVDNKLVYIPSRYLQLQGAIERGCRDTGGGGGGKSRPPFWTDAFDALREIDETVAAWQPMFTGVPPTVGRLNCLQARGWRPQDCRQLQQITEALKAWAGAIDTLLDPPRRWSIAAPCPACGKDIVYRRDNGGERVRQAALQVDAAAGCYCLNCRYVWAPYRFRILAEALNCPLPEGVLE